MKNRICYIVGLFILTSCTAVQQKSTDEIMALQETVDSLKKELVLAQRELQKERKQHLTDLTTSIKTLILTQREPLERLSFNLLTNEINRLVTETVTESDHLVRGIFMSDELIPLVYVSEKKVPKTTNNEQPLKDSITDWCIKNALANEVSYHSFHDTSIKEGTPLLEFCMAITYQTQILGYIRYTFSHNLLSELE